MVKKPPISLSELGNEIEEENRGQPGELSYTQSGYSSSSSGAEGGRDWRGLFGGVVLSVLLAGLLILFLTPSKASIKTLDENVREVAGQVESVRNSVDTSYTELTRRTDTAVTEARSAKSALDGYVQKSEIPQTPDLSPYALRTEIPSQADLSEYTKKSDLQALEATIAALQARVKALEEAPSRVSTEAVRWYASASMVGTGVTVAITDTYPSRIEGEGLYELTLAITWSEGAVVDLNSLLVTLTPRAGDASAIVSRTGTWLEMLSSGRPWNVGVRPGSDGTTRRVDFSWPFEVEAKTQVIEMEMYLAYD